MNIVGVLRGFHLWSVCHSPFLQTVFANPLVIELLLFHQVAFHFEGGFMSGSLLFHQVVDLSAVAAEEVHMGMYVPVIAHVVVINGDHGCHLTLREHAQRIVYRGLAQRRDPAA